jgi:hypothetical protein
VSLTNPLAGELVVGIASGVTAIGLFELVRHLRQWWVDTYSKEPLAVLAAGWGLPLSPQIRVLARNLRSQPVRVVTAPLDEDRHPVNGWNAIAPRGGTPIPNAIHVPGHGWAEYWVQFNNEPARTKGPKELYLLASHVTFQAGVPQHFPILFDRSTEPVV